MLAVFLARHFSRASKMARGLWLAYFTRGASVTTLVSPCYSAVLAAPALYLKMANPSSVECEKSYLRWQAFRQHMRAKGQYLAHFRRRAVTDLRLLQLQILVGSALGSLQVLLLLDLSDVSRSMHAS